MLFSVALGARNAECTRKILNAISKVHCYSKNGGSSLTLYSAQKKIQLEIEDFSIFRKVGGVKSL